MKLRPYQEQGKATIFSGWELYDIIMFVLATGGGKTVTFTEVIREFASKKMLTMLLAHREELITQAHKTLQRQGINSGIIKADYPFRPEFKTQVASIQTLGSRLTKIKNLWPNLDLIVIDEGHHVQEDNTYGRVLQTWPDAKVLIVTATPYRLSGRGFTNIMPGKEVHLIVNLTFKQSIDEGWLVPIDYWVCDVPDLSGVDIVKGEYETEGTSKVMMLAPLVESYIKHAYGMQGICFCVDVAHSIDTARRYNEAGIPAAHVDGETPQAERDKIFKDFKDKKIYMVCNVGILTEGTDFPVCECVQLGSPSMSLAKILQEIGRGSRILPGVIDGLATAAERKFAIAMSKKKNCTVLDNTGAFLEHGFPDDEHDWPYYFSGWKKLKAAKATEDDEFIEMLLFEVEDPKTGERKTTTDVEETIGLRLVRITKEMRENLAAGKHIRQFDKIYKEALQKKTVGKPGYYTFYRWLEYCKKNNIQITDNNWKYIRLKLIKEIDLQVDDYHKHAHQLGKTVIPSVNKDIAAIRAKGVSNIFIKHEKDKYNEWLANVARLKQTG